MPNNNTYTTTIFLNDEQAVNRLNELQASVEKYRKAKQKALLDGDDKAFKTANKQIRECEKEMKALSTTAQNVDRVLNNLSTASVNEIKNTIRAINKELNSGAVERGSREWDYFQKKLKDCRKELHNIQRESAAATEGGFLKKAYDFFNYNMDAIAGILGSITALSLSVRQAANAYAGMEESMADVRKYTGQTDEEVRRMNEDFKKMDTRTSREELNELAGAAGRLGIQGTEAIEEFVDGADKINVALGEDLGEGAVDKIGKLAQMFGEDDRLGLRGAMLATGSAVNDLAQSSSANAGYIVDFTTELSGVAIQAGMTQQQLMGLASALDQNGQEAATSATVFSQLITAMFQDPARFAKIAGIEVSKFTELLKTDANAALIQFLETMSAKGGFDAMAPMFKEMRLDGTRAVGVLSSVASHLDQLKEAQEIANKAYADGKSVLNEFNVQNNTVQAGLDKAKKDFLDLTVTLGEQLMPVVKYTITSGGILVKSLSVIVGFVTKHANAVMTLAAAVSTYIAIQKASIVVDKLKVLWTGKIVTGLKVLYATMLKNPYFAVTAAVFTLIAAYRDWRKSIKEVNQAQLDLLEVEKNALNLISSEKDYLSDLYKRATEKASSDIVRKKAIEELNKISPEYLGWLTTENINTQAAKKAVDAYTQSLLLNAKAKEIAAKLDEVSKKKDEARNKDYSKWYDGFQTAVNDIADKIERTRNGLRTLFSEGSFSTGWDDNTSLDGYALNTASAALIRYNNEMAVLNDEERTLRTELGKTNKAMLENKAVYEKSLGAHTGISDNANANYGTGQSQAETDRRRKIEKERKRAEQEEEKRRKEDNKKEIAALTRHLTELEYQYGNGLIDYGTYIKQREKLQLESLNRRKQIWGEESSEAKLLADDELRIRQEAADRLKKIDLDEIERARLRKEVLLNATYYSRDSDIYQDEDALNEALFQNDMDALNKRMALEKKGTEEWTALKGEIEEKENEHKYELQIRHEEKLLELKKEYLNRGGEIQQELELKWLDKFHEEGLLSEEEYQQALMAIRAKYAAEPVSADERTRQTAVSSLHAAETDSGHKPEYVTDGSDMGVTAFASIFKIVEYRRKVNEDLKALYGEDYENCSAYNEAKSMNNQTMLEELVGATSAAFGSINNITNAASAYAQACSDYEVAKIQANYDKQIEAAGNNSAKREKLEKERDEKIKEAKNKANKKAMKIEIAQAFASTALAAINAYSSTAKIPIVGPALAPVAAAVATAAGMLQVATIKKQHQAEQAGYYKGGFTGPGDYRKEAGVVHAGEFVANHHAVNNPQILPALQLIDQAQRNNTVASLTADDVSRAVGAGSTAVVAPVVNVNTDNDELNRVISDVATVVDSLNTILSTGIKADVNIDGPNGLDAQYRKYKRLKG